MSYSSDRWSVMTLAGGDTRVRPDDGSNPAGCRLAIASQGVGAQRLRLMSTYARFYEVVRRVPRGRVTTYGTVAHEAGLPGRARQVGYAMSALSDDHDVPWHRVINARGEISGRAGGRTFETIQRTLLEAEGVAFDERGRVDLDAFGWP